MTDWMVRLPHTSLTPSAVPQYITHNISMIGNRIVTSRTIHQANFWGSPTEGTDQSRRVVGLQIHHSSVYFPDLFIEGQSNIRLSFNFKSTSSQIIYKSYTIMYISYHILISIVKIHMSIPPAGDWIRPRWERPTSPAAAQWSAALALAVEGPKIIFSLHSEFRIIGEDMSKIFCYIYILYIYCIIIR